MSASLDLASAGLAPGAVLGISLGVIVVIALIAAFVIGARRREQEPPPIDHDLPGTPTAPHASDAPTHRAGSWSTPTGTPGDAPRGSEAPSQNEHTD